MNAVQSDEDIVEELYAGALAPEALSRALARAVLRAGASGGNIHVVDKATLDTILFVPWGPRYQPQAIEDYFRHWRHVNVHRAAMRRTQGVFLCHEHLSEEVLSRAPYAQDFYFPMGERWLAGAVASDDAHEVSLVFNRSEAHDAFDGVTKRLITDLLPHVRRAASLSVASAKKNAVNTSISEALSLSTRPAWLVDAKLRILWFNPAAENLMRLPSPLRDSAGRLDLHDEREQSKLASLVHAAAHRRLEGAAAQSMLVQDEATPIELEVMPATVPDSALRGAKALAMVLGRQADLSPSTQARLRERFRLSPTETQLAIDVAKGEELDAIAEARGVSPKTVRTQLRTIYAKTGATRQAELAALVWRLGG